MKKLWIDAATRIFHHQTQNSLVKLISALQQEALRQDQLKLVKALEPNDKCKSKHPGLEEVLGEKDTGELFNHISHCLNCDMEY